MYLYSATGQHVMKLASKDFDVSTLESGIYFLKIETETSRLTTKIIVNH